MSDDTRPQIEALENMRLPELQARYAEVLGEETRCPNKRFLIRRISETLETCTDDAPRPATTENHPGEDMPDETAAPAPTDGEPTNGQPSATRDEAPNGDAGGDVTSS